MEWQTNRGNIIHSRGKKVNQLDIETGKIIKTFDSIACAVKETNPDGSQSQMCITRVCQGKKQTAYKYKWQYSN